jgi:protein-tyrosine-phosphatase
MKKIKLRLTLDVEIEPNGTSTNELKDLLGDIVADAMNFGTITGETPATVESHSYKVEEILPIKRTKDNCKKCGSILTMDGYCIDESCPYESHKQKTPLKDLYKTKVK